jgi:hypothetical protein
MIDHSQCGARVPNKIGALRLLLVFLAISVTVQITSSARVIPYPDTASRMSTSLCAKESYGWFDDISNEAWMRMKSRARTAVQYMHPLKPSTGHKKPIFWYLDNLQVSRLYIC